MYDSNDDEIHANITRRAYSLSTSQEKPTRAQPIRPSTKSWSISCEPAHCTRTLSRSLTSLTSARRPILHLSTPCESSGIGPLLSNA